MIDVDEDEVGMLSKRITRKKSDNRLEIEMEGHREKKLLLIDGSSDSEDYFFPRSSNEKQKDRSA